MLNKTLFTGLLITLLQAAIIAQTSTGRIRILQTLNEKFKFEEVISTGRDLLQNTNNLLENEIKLIHEYIAISFFTLGEPDSAHLHFMTLLSMDKNYSPDPIRTSPKIRDFFANIKEEYNNLDNQNRPEYIERYMFVEDLRPNAAWRSIVLPGWGQLYKNQPVKGYVFGGTFLVGLLVTTGAWIKENDYKGQYLNSTDPSEISDMYDQYNNWSKIRRGVMYTTIAVWMLNFFDALWSEYPRLDIEINNPDTVNLSVILSLSL